MKINKTFYIFLISIVFLIVGIFITRREYFTDVPTFKSCSNMEDCPSKSRCMNGKCISMVPNIDRRT